MDIFGKQLHIICLKDMVVPSANLLLEKKTICDTLQELNITYIEQYRFNDCRDRRPLPFDFYLPEYDIYIEHFGIDENGSLIFPSSGKNLKESDFIRSTGKNSIPLARHS